MVQDSTGPTEMEELLPPVQKASPAPMDEWYANASDLLKFTVITAMPMRSTVTTLWHHALRSQLHKNWEHIVLEYGGTESKAVWHAGNSSTKSGNAIVPMYSKTEALNKALSLGSGDIIAFLPLNCVYKDKHVLSRVAQRMIDPEIDLVYGDVECVIGGNSVKTFKAGKAGIAPQLLLKNGMLPSDECVFVRSDWWQFVGGLDSRLQHVAETARILDFLAQPGLQVDYIEEVLVTSTRNIDSSSNHFSRVREEVSEFSKRKLLGAYLMHKSRQQKLGFT